MVAEILITEFVYNTSRDEQSIGKLNRIMRMIDLLLDSENVENEHIVDFMVERLHKIAMAQIGEIEQGY